MEDPVPSGWNSGNFPVRSGSGVPQQVSYKAMAAINVWARGSFASQVGGWGGAEIPALSRNYRVTLSKLVNFPRFKYLPQLKE